MKSKMLLVFGLILAFLFALCIAASGASGATSSAAPSFAPSAPWSGNDVGTTSGDARAVVVGDLDHDGDDDLASGDTSGNVVVWQNDGTPFTSQWISNTIGNCGAVVYSLALGDFDNDGSLDLVSGCSTAAAWEIVAWENDGTPFIGSWTGNGVGGAAHVMALAVGDLDNDGYLDLVSGDSGAVIDAWRNDGTPFSGAWTVQTVGNTTNAAYAVAVGDLDNDGDLDIASGDANDSLKVWQNDGAPFSGAWTANTAGTGKDTFYAVALADLDGDGDLDMVSDLESADVTDYQVAAWQNDGTPFSGSWTVKLVGATDDTVYAVAVADLDNDGRADIVSGSRDTGATYELVAWYSPLSPFADTWTTSDVGASADEVNSVALADLDHDGDPDIVSGSSSAENYELIAWRNDHALKPIGSWTELAQPTPPPNSGSVSLADFDYDGKLDVAVGTTSGLVAWRGDGGTSWTRVGAGPLGITGTWPGVAWGQIDNMSELDLAAASDSNGLRVWLVSQGGAGWDNRSTGLPTTGGFQALALGHIDHDGKLDVAACGKSVGVRLWQGTGASGSPNWVPKTLVSGTLDFCDLAVGRVNHDGDLDVAAASCDSRGVLVWQGDGAFGLSYSASPTTTGAYQAVVLGDLDNDGDADIVASPSSGGIRVWLGDGGKGWADAGVISPSLAVSSLAVGDIDRDGYLDIAAGLTGAGGVRVWRGDGGATWTDLSADLPVTNPYYGIALGRVDADGALDIVGAGPGGVRVWAAFEPPPSGWTNFQPAAGIWTRSQQVTCTVQVADAGSGLDVSTAQYRFSRNGGSTWVGDWLTATLSGSDGATAPQVMTATNVLFNQDSSTRNVIQFRIQDMAGLTGTSPLYTVQIDSTPPTNPGDITSPSHLIGAWSSDRTINFTWTQTGTDNVSGVYGYSFDLTQNASDRPDEDADLPPGPPLYLVSKTASGDGSWYFHLMTEDRAGNWSTPAHLGPYRIDTTGPTTPTLDWSSHTVGGWSNDNTIYATWTTSDSGDISGYSFVWDDHPSLYVDTITDTATNSTTSGALADDRWYLHVRAVDQAGNAGGIAHFGPFGVDTADPYSCWINAPATCGSSCAIEWSYYDATSGVATYDVQVRYEDAATPTWEDWRLGTTGTSAVYTDTRSPGTYSFRVRARDQAGNLSGYDCSEQTIVDDIRAYELEVTQGIQNLDNDVPLIADKTTYVRFYVTSYGDVPSVDARLYGTRGGVDLPGSPLRPTGGRITTHWNGGSREDVGDSFYFRLPSEWRSGTVTLRAVVNPSHDVAETDYTDNEITETVTFGTSGDFCMVMIPVHLHPHTYFIEDHETDFWNIIRLAKWIYPVRNDGIGIYSVGEEYPEWHWAGWEYGIPDDFDVILQDTEGVDFWTEDPCHDTHYYGMVHPDSYPGSGTDGIGERYNNYVGDNAASVMLVSDGRWPEPVGGTIMAHELGHNFRRKHVLCTGGEPDGGEVDNSYPYPDRPPCRIGPDDPQEYYGFWPVPGGTPEVITPTEAADLMSYAGTRWPSDWTYRALLDELRDLARTQAHDAPLTLSPAWAQATEYLFASGLISPTGQTAELRAFYRTSSPDSEFVARSYQQEIEAASSDTVYSLVLQDAVGNILYTHTFTAAALTSQGAAPARVPFAEVLPYTPATRIALKQGNTTLASRSVSAHSPTVTVLSPNGGENVTDQLLISWTGADADGDVLRYVVQYSPDDGATWHALAVDWMSTHFTVDAQSLAALPGSSQARIRVIATDGINTAEDQSNAVFTVARKSPQAHILEPLGGSEFKVGDTIVFMGTGMDAEDGPLGATSAITWTSSLSGTLGVGAELWASDLLTGTHRVTMTVTDSDGNAGTDEVIVFVGVSPEKIYLPIVLKN